MTKFKDSDNEVQIDTASKIIQTPKKEIQDHLIESDGESRITGLTEIKRNITQFIEEVKDGPWFTQSKFIRDAEGRTPEDPNYDPTTLDIPE